MGTWGVLGFAVKPWVCLLWHKTGIKVFSWVATFDPESFTDLNGDGVYTPVEPFIDCDTLFNLCLSISNVDSSLSR